MKPKVVVICAAGMGRRLGQEIPKCLMKLGNKTLIERQLNLFCDIPQIIVVTGYKDNLVRNLVRSICSKVKFVYNPYYYHTNNDFSIYLATKDLVEPFLICDADLLISIDSYEEFINSITLSENLFSITKLKSQDAIGVSIDNKNRIIGFKKRSRSKYEWVGLSYLADIIFHKNGTYNFEGYSIAFPAKYKLINCYEIDTPSDLELARKNLNNIDE